MQARTEREWQRLLKERGRRWTRMRLKSGKRANVDELGPMPLPPQSLIDYFTPTEARQK